MWDKGVGYNLSSQVSEKVQSINDIQNSILSKSFVRTILRNSLICLYDDMGVNYSHKIPGKHAQIWWFPKLGGTPKWLVYTGKSY